jgi:aspartyl-tRNA(Asn)/glutamyl-tRNA(Gln) amidotransferase subunit A
MAPSFEKSNEWTNRSSTASGRAGVNATAAALAAIAERDPELNAFLTVCAGAAGRDGIPLAVKDIFDTAGVRTTYGSQIFGAHVPEQTAEAVARLERAGHVVVGKTNLHEFAFGVTSENPHFGAVRNPADARRIAGGSSGGSAVAVATGMSAVALGTDTGGSIRIPAALCGVAGFKPSFGAVPVDGLFPLAPSFDHVGPLAPTVDGCADAFAVLAGTERAEAVDLEAVTVGVPKDAFDLCGDEVEHVVRAALSLLPPCVPVAFPALDAFDNRHLLYTEARAVHAVLFPARADEYGPDVRERLEAADASSADDVRRSRSDLAAFKGECLRAVEHVDLLALPTVPIVAPRLGTREVAVRGRMLPLRDVLTRNVRVFNSLGWPALAVPCPVAAGELPVSLQLVGRPGEDALVLGAGLALERALAKGEALCPTT